MQRGPVFAWIVALWCLFGLGTYSEAQSNYDFDIFANGRYVCSELETPKFEVPLRLVAEQMGATVEYDSSLNAVYITPKDAERLRPKREEWWAGRIPHSSKSVPSVFVGAKFVANGFMRDDALYVWLRDVAEALGATVEYNATARKIGITSRGVEPLKLIPGTFVALTQGKWWPIANTRGMSYRNAAVTGDLNRFSVEVRIDRGIWQPSKKPISVYFLVTLYDVDGRILDRGTFPIYGIPTDGGVFQLEGPNLRREAMTCVIQYASAWTPQ